MGAELRFGLHVHAVYTVKEVEVVDVGRTGKGFERGKDIGYRYTQQLGAVAVHIKEQLWNGVLHRGRYASHFLAA